MKLLNLSPKTDFYLKLQSNLDILMKNVLYITHELDQVKKIVQKLEHDHALQKTVDEYFDEKDEDSKQEEE